MRDPTLDLGGGRRTTTLAAGSRPCRMVCDDTPISVLASHDEEEEPESWISVAVSREGLSLPTARTASCQRTVSCCQIGVEFSSRMRQRKPPRHLGGNPVAYAGFLL